MFRKVIKLEIDTDYYVEVDPITKRVEIVNGDVIMSLGHQTDAFARNEVKTLASALTEAIRICAEETPNEG